MSLYLKQIEQLVALQKVDDEIFLIRRDLAGAPKEIEKLRADFKVMEERRAQLLDKLEHLKDQSKRLNGDIEDDSNRIRKSKNKMMQVGNAKEYHAMMREMDSLERTNRGREEERLVLAEELARQEGIFSEFEESYGVLQSSLAEKEGSLAERVEKGQNSLAALDKERRETGKVVPLPVLSRYEFIRERLAHPVIVPVQQGICSGCHISIPPQSYIELQKGTQILSCPNCQRLVYWEEHFMDPSAKPAPARRASVAKEVDEAEDDLDTVTGAE